MAQPLQRARSLAGTWIALLFLTGLSFLLSRARLGSLEIVVALGIAVVKSSLVVLIFMHWLAERSTPRLVVFVVAFYIFLLASLATADVATRKSFPKTPHTPAEQR
jgi:cytochrome c oxidase subunit 4